MRKRLDLAVAAFVLAAQPSVAAPYDDAFASYQKGDYATALKLMRPLAENGDANAQYNMGAMYMNSLGVQQDHKQAAKWFEMAAAKGNVFAEADLATLYESGLGVPKDYKEAMRLFKLAAAQKNPIAEAHIGTMYDRGLGVPQDYAEAVRLNPSDSTAAADVWLRCRLMVMDIDGGKPREYCKTNGGIRRFRRKWRTRTVSRRWGN